MMKLSYIEEAAVLVAIGHGLRTFPMPKNQYGKWALGVLQATFSNYDLAKKNFSNAPMDDVQHSDPVSTPSTPVTTVETPPKR